MAEEDKSERTEQPTSRKLQQARDKGDIPKSQEIQAYKDRYRIVSDLVSDYAYAFRVEPDGTIIGEWVT